MESEWIDAPMKRHPDCLEKTCPRCGCRSYYDCTPEIAWCWWSGLIEIGDAAPPDHPDGSGVIVIANGQKYALRAKLSAMARHGKGESAGKLFVPGVPEASTSKTKADALEKWLAWATRSRGRDGVVFSSITAAP